jgi:large subunit ribosomal protein L4
MAAVVSLHNGSGIRTGDFEIKSLSSDVLVPSSTTRSIYFRVVLNNLRQFNASTKTRGEVTGSNRKPWKQKGTGRARVGDAQSPLWRKGGIMFGPRPGGRELAINRKASRSIWRWVFASFLKNNAIACLDVSEDSFGVSTSKARLLLEGLVGKAEMFKKTFTLLVSEDSLEMTKSFRNLQNVALEFYDRKDIRSLRKSDMILFFKNDANLFEDMVAKYETN